MKQRSFVILLVAVVVLGGAIGGAFVGGIAVGKNQAEQEAVPDLQSQLTSRFGQRAAQGDTAQDDRPQTGVFGGFMGRQGTVGTVEQVEGNVLTLNTMMGTTVRVLIADDTLIQKTGEGTLDDISPGSQVTVSGEAEDDGSINATSIFITPAFDTP